MVCATQVAALRQQLATLRGENMALRRALAADGKDQLEDGMLLLPSALGLGGGGGATALAEALQSENSSLELENTRLRMQMVRVLLGCGERAGVPQTSGRGAGCTSDHSRQVMHHSRVFQKYGAHDHGHHCFQLSFQLTQYPHCLPCTPGLPFPQDDLRAELSIITDRCCGLQAQLDLLQATQAAASAGAITSDGLPHTPAPGQGASSTAAAASVVDGLLKGYVSRIAELERELRAARQFQGLRRRTTTPSVPGGAPAAAAGSHGGQGSDYVRLVKMHWHTRWFPCSNSQHSGSGNVVVVYISMHKRCLVCRWGRLSCACHTSCPWPHHPCPHGQYPDVLPKRCRHCTGALLLRCGHAAMVSTMACAVWVLSIKCACSLDTDEQTVPPAPRTDPAATMQL
jgi:hypothetical protein